MNPHLPTLQALDAPDDRLLQDELRCLRVRQHAAGLRVLADQLDLVTPSRMDAGMRTHLLEVLARLGCAILDTGEEPAKTTPQVGKRPLRLGELLSSARA